MRLLVFVLAATAAAQSWEQQLADARSALSRGSFEEAKMALESVMASAAPRPAIEEAAIELAHIHQALGDYLAGDALIAKTFEQRRERVGRADVSLAPLHLERAMSLRLRGMAQQALGQALYGHQLLRLHNGPVHESLAQPLELMGMLFADLQNYSSATRSYEEAIALLDQLGTSEDRTLRLLDTLGDLYRNLSMYKAAEPKYRRSLSIRERRLGPFDAELIPAVDGLAYVLFGLKRYSDAEPVYERLLALWEKNGGPDHPMTALTLEKTAGFRATQGQYERADCLLERALQIRRKTLTETLRQKARMQRAMKNEREAGLLDNERETLEAR